jgi:hypothetical protein
VITAVVIILALAVVVFAWFAAEVRAASHPPVTADQVNNAPDMWGVVNATAPNYLRQPCGCIRWAVTGGRRVPCFQPCPAHAALLETELQAARLMKGPHHP